MNISCLQDNLQKSIQLVSHLSGKDQSLPILSTILLKAEDGKITVQATNLELASLAHIRGKIQSEGSVALPAKIFIDYISLLPRERVDIEVHNDYLVHIHCLNYSTKIRGCNPDDFPPLPLIESQARIECEAEVIKKALQKTLFTVNIHESKPELSGFLFTYNSQNKQLYIIGTDAYRLAEAALNAQSSNENIMPFIIPLRCAQELYRLVSQDDQSSLTIHIQEYQIAFTTQNAYILSKLIQGTYPDYKQIIPQQFSTKIIFDVEQLIKGVKTTSLFSQSSTSDIHVKLISTNRQGRIFLSSSNTTTGESVVQFDVDFQGEDNEFVVNYRYLLDGLQALSTKKALLSIIDSASPCVLKPFESEGYQYLIMPIRQ